MFFDQVTTSKALDERFFAFWANAPGFLSPRQLISRLCLEAF